MPEISIMPEPFYIGPVNVGLSVVVAWCVMAALICLMLLARWRISRFTDVPRGFQAAMEMIVGGMESFAKGKVGHAAKWAAPMVFALMLYVSSTTIVELFGVPPATEDLNCTLALGISAFAAVNIVAVKVLGVKGRIKAWMHPVAAVAPIRILTDCITPFSMAIRLFANVLAGGIIMKLIYAAMPVILPAALGAYFNVLHTAIQTFVFGLLPLMYMGEALETAEG